jgi:hypothetical protein
MPTRAPPCTTGKCLTSASASFFITLPTDSLALTAKGSSDMISDTTIALLLKPNLEQSAYHRKPANRRRAPAVLRTGCVIVERRARVRDGSQACSRICWARFFAR